MAQVAHERGIAARRREVWFADKAGVGQKTPITRRRGRRGSRPMALQDPRTASTDIFGAICPGPGKAAGLVLPDRNIEAMTLPLAGIAFQGAKGAHAVLVPDQAGWHVSDTLVVPPSITLVPLVPKCPELNPVETVWQHMRRNRRSNRIVDTRDDIVEHCAQAWSRLADQPWTIMSIGLQARAYRF